MFGHRYAMLLPQRVQARENMQVDVASVIELLAQNLP